MKVYCKNCKHYQLGPVTFEKYCGLTGDQDYVSGGRNLNREICSTINKTGDCTNYVERARRTAPKGLPGPHPKESWFTKFLNRRLF